MSALLLSWEGSRVNNNTKNSPLAPTQDQLKHVNEFFNNTATKLTSAFNSESDFACSTEHVDNHDVKGLKNKLKAIKESRAFAKETGNFEGAKKNGGH